MKRLCGKGEGGEHTQHVAALVLLTARPGDVRGYPEIHDDELLLGEGVHIQASQYGEAAALVDVFFDLIEPGTESWERECRSVYFCPFDAES